MIIRTIEHRFHYMRGYFACVTENPENFIKEDLIFYFKELRKFLDNPSEPLDDKIIGRSV